MIKESRVTYKSEAEIEEINFWKSKSFEEKISIVQVLREQYIVFFNKRDKYAESRKRLRRVYKIIK
ncbi:MAG TPA: hypothetical protein VIH28_03785 [Ignavibacteriaceae bacterium]